MLAPTSLDAGCVFLALVGQFVAFELWAVLSDGTTLSQAYWDIPWRWPWLDVPVLALLALVGLHLVQHEWLVATWEYFTD